MSLRQQANILQSPTFASDTSEMYVGERSRDRPSNKCWWKAVSGGGGRETAFGGCEYFAERLATNHDNAVDVGHNNGIVPSLVEDRPAASREQPLGELASGLAVI